MRSAMVRVLRRLRSEQSGQSLIIVSLTMAVVMGASGMAIDAAGWYQKHHEVQVATDAAALAAANCLSNAGAGSTCTSSTDVADAQQVAVTYAAQNGITITASDVTVDTSNATVHVTANNTSAALFANLVGIRSSTQTAQSTATWASGGSTACTSTEQSAGQCYAVYTQNATCGSSDGWIVGSAGITITGGIHTQGSLNMEGSGGTYTITGPFTYSSGNCTYTPNQETTFTSGSTTPSAGGNESASYWPLNFATDFPACSATGTVQCTTINGQTGVPSYCTDESTSSSGFVFGWSNSGTEPFSGHVYCSIGTGSPSNPATWNGPITFADGASAGTSSSPLTATFIGGYVSATSSTLYLAPGLDNCLFYALDTDAAADATSNGSATYAIELQNGTYGFGGTMFAPNGTINLGSTSGTAGFLEAQNVNTTNLSFTGNGPLVSSSSSGSSSGGDSLLQ
jgi:Flp pilus assembly protein TadG